MVRPWLLIQKTTDHRPQRDWDAARQLEWPIHTYGNNNICSARCGMEDDPTDRFLYHTHVRNTCPRVSACASQGLVTVPVACTQASLTRPASNGWGLHEIWLGNGNGRDNRQLLRWLGCYPWACPSRCCLQAAIDQRECRAVTHTTFQPSSACHPTVAMRTDSPNRTCCFLGLHHSFP